MSSFVSSSLTARRREPSRNTSMMTVATIFMLSIFINSVTATTCIQQYLPPQLRYPPYPLKPQNQTTQSWTPPQSQDLYGTYFITYSSRLSYQSLTNLRGEHYPVFPQTSPSFPPGSEVDIVSWSTSPTNTTDTSITTVFGWFKPLSPNHTPAATWSYSSTGILSNTTNLYAILGYGLDQSGHAYRVDYETGYYAPGASPTNAQPCINVASRVEGGPDQVTLDQIVAGLKVVGYEEGDMGFVELVEGLKRLRVDGRRSGEGPVTCDEACVMNRDLVPQ